MFAVFTPCLRQSFKFHVSQLCAQSGFFSVRLDLGGPGIGLQGFHFLQVQRQHPLAADLQKVRIGDSQVNLSDLYAGITDNPGNINGEPLFSIKLRSRDNRPALNQSYNFV